MRMDLWGVIALAGWTLSFLAFAIFCVLYQVGTRGYWRYTYVGRHLMSMGLVVVVILGFFLARVLLGDYPGWRQILALGAVAFAVVGWHRVALVYSEQWGKDKQ